MTTRDQYLEALQAWGLHPDRLAEEPEAYLFGLTDLLNVLGLEVGLATACIRTHHPQLDMLVMRWRPREIEEVPTESTNSILGQERSVRSGGVQDLYALTHGHTDETMYLESPFYRALEKGELVRVRLEPPPSPAPFPIIDDLVERGMTDYVVFPLAVGDSATAAVSLASRLAGGLPSAFLEAFKDNIPLLAMSTAHKVERFQFREVLKAYIGTEPAALVMAGQIKRGDMISKRAVLGFTDLRRFRAATHTAKYDTHSLSTSGHTLEEVKRGKVKGMQGEAYYKLKKKEL